MINKLLSKTVAVFGLGRTGMAVARELKLRGVHVIGWDEKENLRNEAKEKLQKLLDIINEGKFDELKF